MSVICYACKKNVQARPNGEGMVIAIKHKGVTGEYCPGSREAYEPEDVVMITIKTVRYVLEEIIYKMDIVLSEEDRAEDHEVARLVTHSIHAALAQLPSEDNLVVEWTVPEGTREVLIEEIDNWLDIHHDNIAYSVRECAFTDDEIAKHFLWVGSMYKVAKKLKSEWCPGKVDGVSMAKYFK